MYDVCIIGGGVSGMLAAILLAKRGLSVVICEANDRLGKKLLATGNGRANLSNVDMSATYYNDNSIADMLNIYDTDFVRKLWFELGLLTKMKSGRIYPYCEQANSVLNVLLANIAKYNIKVYYSCIVKKIERSVKGFTVISDSERVTAFRICLATGSSASFGRDSGSLFLPFGHNITQLRPGLCPMRVINAEDITGLSGVRQEGEVSLYVKGRLLAREYGEIQFRRDSVSGIVIFNHSSRLARQGAEDAEIGIDFMPEYTLDSIQKMMSDNILAESGLLNKFLMRRIEAKGVESIKDYRIKVRSMSDKSQAQVICGGLQFSDFDSGFESIKTKGLYAIGESLDIDGLCGGYNLHWAAISAYIFAEGVMKNVTKTV